MGDSRKTVSEGKDFIPLLMDLRDRQQKAAVLYEDNGVTRGSGSITSIHEKAGKTWLVLDNRLEIAMDKLYAVNGTFSSDYSEC